MSDYGYERLDELLHSRIRLAAVSFLSGLEEAEFTRIREAVGATDGNLSTHLRKLEDAGYIAVRKTFEKRKSASYYSLTISGREAFSRYIDELGSFLHR
jgi:DNA-binding MarR family transcriptional regulator